ncbi:hypothetical protein MYCO108962_19160 [Mycobacterium colombiense]|uniref:Uncharacterized protein n=2 Tax=Mycobacterium colombiense TaxID=339268 RepID=J5DZJ9_9MYCO|nr:hypothetical protein MCOL_V218686 [Mycobacterium colombiense CECT 3035]
MGLSLPDGRPETKYKAWRFESGQDRLSRFLAALGLTSLVCGLGHAARPWLDARMLSAPARTQLLVVGNIWRWGRAPTAPDGTA